MAIAPALGGAANLLVRGESPESGQYCATLGLSRGFADDLGHLLGLNA